MRNIAIALLLSVFPTVVLAAGGHVHLDAANVNLSDRASLQRGAKYFVNYCLSCHSASFMRYNRMGKDLGLTDEQVQENLMFAADKVGETMDVAMRPRDAGEWFGVSPPDLSVIARSRSPDWLYTYLRSFYLDESRPFGVNNRVFPDVAMPHVLWELQGLQKAVFKQEKGEDGTEHQVFEGFEIVDPGGMDEREYDRAIRDLVNFLVYMGEPIKLHRQRIGFYVLLFLAIFFVLAYMLKKEYWKDVH